MSDPACQSTQRWLDGQLTGAEAQAAEAHAAGCAECRALVRSWQALVRAARESDAALLAPPNVQQVQALLRKARQSKPSPSRRPLQVGLALAAVALVAVAAWRLQAPAPPLECFAVGPQGEQTPLLGEVLEAPEGHQTQVVLGRDRLGLAGHSRVKLERRDQRQVRLRLESGSVAAVVSPRQAGQSFVVAVGGVEVTVVGTRFRVVQLPEGARVDVIEGHVRVKGFNQTFEVLRGHSLQLAAGAAAQTTFEPTQFEELSAPAPPPAEELDAGEPTTSEPPEPTIEEPPAGVKPVSAAQVERWRRSALAGQCRALVAPLRVKAREHPRQAEVWRVLADCLRLLGDDPEAASAYQRVAATAGPEEADRARLLLADLLQDRLGQHARAERVLREYLSHPQPPALEASARVKLAHSLIALKKPAQARAVLERVVATLPSSPPALEALQMLKSLPPSN